MPRPLSRLRGCWLEQIRVPTRLAHTDVMFASLAVPVGLLFGFSACLFTLYSFVPILMQLSSATMLNLALLTSDVYSLLFGLFLFRYSVRRRAFCLFYYRVSLLV